MSVWRPPRRNGHYLSIEGVTHSLMEWSRRCGISHNNLLMEARRNGRAAMIARIKLGLKSAYRPTTGGAFHREPEETVTTNPDKEPPHDCPAEFDRESTFSTDPPLLGFALWERCVCGNIRAVKAPISVMFTPE